MSVEVREISDDSDTWSRCVERSSQSTVFHRSGFLSVLEDHSGMDLRRLVGYKGQEIIGALPLYVTSKGPANIVYSPPPNLGISYLGPITLNVDKLKRRKRERRQRDFIQGCLDWIDDEVDPKYIHLRSTAAYDDPRAFQWADFRATPRYTYTVDLQRDPSKIKQSFSKSLRRYLDPDSDTNIEISVGGEQEIEFIYDEIRARYEAQDRPYPLTLDFIRDIDDALGDQLQPYVGRIDGELVAGVLVPEDDTTRYFWQGGGKPDTDYPINDLLHWHIIKDGHDNGLNGYDLYGANTERLCTYKAKFNGGLSEYYELERESAISKVYKMIR